MIANPWHFAANGGRWQAHIDVSSMPRLSASLHRAAGEVSASLRGSVDEQGVALLSGRAETEVELICQRCLQPMTTQLQTEFHLGLIADEAQFDQLPETYEPLLVNTPLDPAELIEDELLLVLPFAPRHPIGHSQCTDRTANAGIGIDKTPSGPFADLASLLSDLKKT